MQTANQSNGKKGIKSMSIMDKRRKVCITAGIRAGIILTITVAVIIFMNYAFHVIVSNAEMTESVIEYHSYSMLIVGIITGSAIMIIITDALKQLEEGEYCINAKLFTVIGILSVSAAELAMAIIVLGYPGVVPGIITIIGLTVTNFILFKAKSAIDDMCKVIMNSENNIFDELFLDNEEEKKYCN